MTKAELEKLVDDYLAKHEAFLAASLERRLALQYCKPEDVKEAAFKALTDAHNARAAAFRALRDARPPLQG